MLVRAPVQAGERLSGQSHVLQEVERPGHAYVHAIRVLLASLSRIFTRNDKCINAQWRMQESDILVFYVVLTTSTDASSQPPLRS